MHIAYERECLASRAKWIDYANYMQINEFQIY